MLGLSPKTIEKFGLGEIQSRLGQDKVRQVLMGIDQSIIEAWYLLLGLVCISVIGSLMMAWHSV